MAYQITVNYPNLKKGEEVVINGLGTYKNGSTSEVSDDEAQSFRTYQTACGMPDQTLLQAFKSDENVQVVTAGAANKTDTADKTDENKDGDK